MSGNVAGVIGRGLETFWGLETEEALKRVNSSSQGLTTEQASDRRNLQVGKSIPAGGRHGRLNLLLTQFLSPIILILLLAAGLSASLGQITDSSIILAIVLISGLIGYWQEYRAAEAVESLLAQVRIKTTVIRDGLEVDIPVEEVVPGDLVVLNAGDIIPADCLILDSTDLHLDEAALTGETYPAEKASGILPGATVLGRRSNSLFRGTHVVSGTGTALVILTGRETEFGRLSERISQVRPEAEFERGLRRFGYFLMQLTFVLVLIIFAVNVALGRTVLEALLFSTALAVGLTPQLLPAIIGVNLAHGAREMARRQVIVKRLASIESFGSMDVLCSDKTGTLTEGSVQIQGALDFAGRASENVFFQAYLNASFESGFTNPIDDAIRGHRSFDLSGYRKVGEVPYDFIRKRLSVEVEREGRHFLVTKGALMGVLAACTRAEGAGGDVVDLASVRPEIERLHEELSSRESRTLGVAYRDLDPDSRPTREREADMTFLGLLVLHDPPKAGVEVTIRQLNHLGITTKILTGDNRLVASRVGELVGLTGLGVLTGPEIALMSNDALTQKVGEVGIFAEVEPNQKERILLAIKRAGHVVGYLGDGINDASALHAADVGISVDSAVDVAKKAADIVLLKKDLGVLIEGVREGRVAFANTLKYVNMATSANFGNMLSMAGLSPFLPFLPLLPKQILLMNLLTDLPEMAIATDGVDSELIESPRRWDVREIRKFMLVFGVVSSLFDFASFGVLLLILKARPEQFRTGWFVESVISASVIVLVIRTRRPLFGSRPAKALLASTIVIILATLALPFSELGSLLGFQQLPALFLIAMGAIVVAYVAAAELTKRIYFSKGLRGQVDGNH
ncbi:magnesium-translocating P-type ATPase [Tundrisphaera lichenicola]|uniref:magnesium-translocating P-type ATPase n=1 Tax=Tundrisphaera lichenicola TaxID=2029860 RepID=UPI003EBA8455